MSDFLVPAGLLLLCLAVLQVQIVSYVTYPPALLCGVWGLALLWLKAAGGRFLPIGPSTIAIYVIGTVVFCIGGALGWGVGARPGAKARVDAVAPGWLIPVLTMVVLLLTPFFVLRLFAAVGAMSPVDFLYAIRVESLEGSLGDAIGILQNIVPFAMMSALAAVALPPGTLIGHICRTALIASALGLTILTGGRGATLTLLLGMGIVASTREQRIPLLRAIGVTAIATVVFGVSAVFLRKGDASPSSTLGDNLVAVSQGIEDYALGGVVAFDGVRSDPGGTPAVWSPLRTVQEMANHLGATYDVPSRHAQFSTIGDGVVTNVYTMYYSYYPEAGFVGMLGLVFIVGVVSGATHRRAVAGSTIAVLFHGVLAPSLLLSVFSEPFYTNANFLLKLALFGLMINLVVRRRRSLPAGAGELERPGP